MLRRTRKSDIELLRRILLWVSFTVLPLTLEELHVAVAIECDMTTLEEVQESRIYNPKLLLTLGGSFINVSEKDHIRLAHLSVKNNLLSTDLKNALEISTFSFSSEEASQELAINCFTYLSLDSMGSGPCNTSIDWTNRLKAHPLLKRASKAWSYYFRAAHSTQQLKTKVKTFFSAESHLTFMSWVQVLNSIGFSTGTNIRNMQLRCITPLLLV